MNSLLELQKIWPVLDEYHKTELKDFLARWTHSWVNFSSTLTEDQQQAKLSQLDRELSSRVAGLQSLFSQELAAGSSPSQDLTNLPLELPEQVSQLVQQA